MGEWTNRQLRRAVEPEPPLSEAEQTAVEQAEVDPDADRARAALERLARQTNRARP